MTPHQPRPIVGHEPDRPPTPPPAPRALNGEDRDQKTEVKGQKTAPSSDLRPPASALSLLLCFLLSAFCFSAKATTATITNDLGSPLTFAFYTNVAGGNYYLASITTIAPSSSAALTATGTWTSLLALNTNSGLGVIIPTGSAIDVTNGWASCLLSNGTPAFIQQQLGSAPATGQTFTWTNWLYNLATQLPGYTQNALATNGTAFFLNDTNVYSGWFTNAPAGMLFNTCHVSWTNPVTGDVFTNGTVSTNLAVSPFLQMGASPWVVNTWSNAPTTGPALPWAVYTINRY